MTIKKSIVLATGLLIGGASVFGFNQFHQEKTPLTYESFKVQEVDNGLYVAKNVNKGTDKDFLAFEASDVLNDQNVKIGDTVKAEYRALKGEDKFIGVTSVKHGKTIKTANASKTFYSSYQITNVDNNEFNGICYNNCSDVNAGVYFTSENVLYHDSLEVGDYVNVTYDAVTDELVKVEKLVRADDNSYVLASYYKGDSK